MNREIFLPESFVKRDDTYPAPALPGGSVRQVDVEKGSPIDDADATDVVIYRGRRYRVGKAREYPSVTTFDFEDIGGIVPGDYMELAETPPDWKEVRIVRDGEAEG